MIMAKKKMISRIKYHYKDKGPEYEINMYIDLKRFEKQFSNAQYRLDNMVMTSMVPFMPMQTGTFINVTKAMSAAIAGSGKVVAAAPPFGRFLYEGKVMIDPATGSPWARKGAQKEVTNRALDFSKAAHPDAQARWFEAAKERDGEKWLVQVKRIAGGGKRG